VQGSALEGLRITPVNLPNDDRGHAEPLACERQQPPSTALAAATGSQSIIISKREFSTWQFHASIKLGEDPL
jgi:hypothetical protein